MFRYDNVDDYVTNNVKSVSNVINTITSNILLSYGQCRMLASDE